MPFTRFRLTVSGAKCFGTLNKVGIAVNLKRFHPSFRACSNWDSSKWSYIKKYKKIYIMHKDEDH